jgi:hypothetical protein
MPRIAAVAAEQAEFILPNAPLPVPEGLTEEQAGYWRDLVHAYPAERFRPDAVPVLIELCQQMALSRQINEQLDEMRHVRLNGLSAKDAKVRRTFGQLAKLAQQTTHQISMLSTKLRLTDQSKRRDTNGARARNAAMPSGPRPWDVGPPKSNEPS